MTIHDEITGYAVAAAVAWRSFSQTMCEPGAPLLAFQGLTSEPETDGINLLSQLDPDISHAEVERRAQALTEVLNALAEAVLMCNGLPRVTP